MRRRIIRFHLDEFDDWVAELECGHQQHVRHQPPWQNRPWVIEEKTRLEFIGKALECKFCRS